MPESTVTRECVWCNEEIPERKDGRLRVHKWLVGWDVAVTDTPIMANCVGSGTSVKDAEEAQHGI